MTTQKFMGRGQLRERLAAQVGSQKLADNILKKRGDMNATGKLTAKGRTRNAMTAEERAKDRAAKKSGRRTSEFKYTARTNRATLKSST